MADDARVQSDLGGNGSRLDQRRCNGRAARVATGDNHVGRATAAVGCASTPLRYALGCGCQRDDLKSGRYCHCSEVTGWRLCVHTLRVRPPKRRSGSRGSAARGALSLSGYEVGLSWTGLERCCSALSLLAPPPSACALGRRPRRGRRPTAVGVDGFVHCVADSVQASSQCAEPSSGVVTAHGRPGHCWGWRLPEEREEGGWLSRSWEASRSLRASSCA